MTGKTETLPASPRASFCNPVAKTQTNQARVASRSAVLADATSPWRLTFEVSRRPGLVVDCRLHRMVRRRLHGCCTWSLTSRVTGFGGFDAVFIHISNSCQFGKRPDTEHTRANCGDANRQRYPNEFP